MKKKWETYTTVFMRSTIILLVLSLFPGYARPVIFVATPPPVRVMMTGAFVRMPVSLHSNSSLSSRQGGYKALHPQTIGESGDHSFKTSKQESTIVGFRRRAQKLSNEPKSLSVKSLGVKSLGVKSQYKKQNVIGKVATSQVSNTPPYLNTDPYADVPIDESFSDSITDVLSKKKVPTVRDTLTKSSSIGKYLYMDIGYLKPEQAWRTEISLEQVEEKTSKNRSCINIEELHRSCQGLGQYMSACYKYVKKLHCIVAGEQRLPPYNGNPF